MDVTESRAAREIEQLNRLLKEREHDHNNELDATREGYRDQIKELKESQQDNLKNIQADVEEHAEEARSHYDEQLERTTDTYEKLLADERRTNYDRLGRLVRDHVRERDQDRQVKNKQMRELFEATKQHSDANRKDVEAQTKNIRQAFEKNRVQMNDYLDRKLGEQNRLHSEALNEATAHSRKVIDKNTRLANENMAREKIGADLKYRKLVDESIDERDKLATAFKTREKQLVDEKNNLLDGGNRLVTQNLAEHRKRSDETLNQLIADNHFLNANKDREFANRLTQQEQDHYRKIQDLTSQFRQAENTLQDKLEAERLRATLTDNLRERRHKQESYLSNEAQRKSANLSEDHLKATYNERLHDLEAKHQDQMKNFSKTVQERSLVQDMRNATERSELQREKTEAINHQNIKSAREKAILVKAYEDRQKSLNDLKERQFEQQKNQFNTNLSATRADAQRTISLNNRENQSRLYQMKQTLENRTNELEMQRQLELGLAKENHEERARRLTEAYHRALQQQKHNFDDTTETLKHDTLVQMAKMRADSDHEKRMQLLEQQTKNRILMTSFETRLNRLKDEHADEVQRLQMEHDKEMRDVLRRTKETLDLERAHHKRELDSRDHQMKEKLRLQEEAFKQDIEKLKRTNELALKKS